MLGVVKCATQLHQIDEWLKFAVRNSIPFTPSTGRVRVRAKTIDFNRAIHE